MVKITSNVKDTAEVKFSISPLLEVPKDLRSAQQASTYHALVFSHKGSVFGEIPLRIEQQ